MGRIGLVVVVSVSLGLAAFAVAAQRVGKMWLQGWTGGRFSRRLARACSRLRARFSEREVDHGAQTDDGLLR